MSDDSNTSIIDYIKTELTISDSTIINQEIFISKTFPLKADLVIEEFPKRYFIEIISRITIEKIGQQLVLKQLIQKNDDEKWENEFVIAGKIVTPNIEEIARECNIRLIMLPIRTRIIETGKSEIRRIEKISSAKSWKIVIALIIEKECSIRQLSLKTKVSYGWAHATIQSLIAKGIVIESNGRIKLHDVPKLLNGIAWERPFEKLYYKEAVLPDIDAITAARTITSLCTRQNIDCGFTSFTAGGLYTHYGFRHDTVYVYISNENLDLFLKLFELKDTNGIKIRVYKSDRDVFSDTRIIEEVRLVSPAQTLLDLAGLGYSGNDLTQKLVEMYDRL